MITPGMSSFFHFARVLTLVSVFGLVFAAGLDWVGAQTTDMNETYDRGLTAYESGDFDGAFEIWRPLAEGGHPVAQYSIGKLYDRGGGSLAQDQGKAAQWYARAAEQGIAAAQNNLALMYAKGTGVDRDLVKAAELWRAAAERGHATAQYNLGLAYFNGEGITQNRTTAADWFRRAAHAGIADSQFVMGHLHRQGVAVEKSEAEALAWYEKAAGSGHERARQQAARLQAKGVVAEMPGAVAAAPDPEPAETTQAETQVAATPEPAEPAEPMAEEPEAAVPEPAPEPEPQMAAEAAPEPEPEPEPESEQTAAVPTAAGDFRVWLASASSQSKADAIWKAAQSGHSRLFTGLSGEIQRASVGGGTYYRVLAGPLASRNIALDLCRNLQSEEPEAFCIVQQK